MPELPEAEVAARQLRARLIGAQVTGVLVGRSDIVREGGDMDWWYPGGVVTAVDRYGKSVAIEFEKAGDRRYLVAELGAAPHWRAAHHLQPRRGPMRLLRPRGLPR